MTLEAMAWAYKIGVEKNLKPTDRHVLWVIADKTDDLGLSWPGNGRTHDCT
ncbi:MAG: hypothetical protein QF393_09530 [Rhodospirillales bacterium]|nr:hypothetical protein [Rhodospirillales bacterium]